MMLGVRNILRMGFFWKKTPQISMLDDIEEAARASPNLSYIIKQIKAKNRSKQKLLPPQDPKYHNKLTVVLQLDQVIAYTFTPDEEGYLLAPLRKYDHYTEYQQYDACLSIYKRQNFDNFLNYISEECQPVLWSTGVSSYVDLVMQYLDPHRKIPYRFTQEHCDLIENKEEQLDVFVKDLNLLGRDMSRVVYIDSKPLSYWMHPNNSYPIQEFKADMTMQSQDLNLLILQLQGLKQHKDIRQNFRQRFQIEGLLKQSNLL